MRWGASSTPAANPTAATQSQKSFLPKNKIIAPIRMLRIGIGRFIFSFLAALCERRKIPVVAGVSPAKSQAMQPGTAAATEDPDLVNLSCTNLINLPLAYSQHP